MTFPDSMLFAAAIEDRRFWAALAIAVLAGVVRGFSGFGSALIYIPLVAAVYSPPVAAVTLLLIDSFGAAPFSVRSFAHCSWREILPIYIAAAIAIPFGTMSLLILDPTFLRWCIAVVILLLLSVLVSGWRYHGRPRLPLTAAIGLFSGSVAVLRRSPVPRSSSTGSVPRRTPPSCARTCSFIFCCSI